MDKLKVSVKKVPKSREVREQAAKELTASFVHKKVRINGAVFDASIPKKALAQWKELIIE